ncbi:hypothetical protein GCM10011409_21280 [Lentibacillus populi]|uniref:Uncharacterized protein n=1 Tax=Lentibacillus populi TaxID=1827502 RepID=A0A9W5X5G4_9BACI|nr:hypothetical protein [Lentibacillus populi]GGB43406.1 hypothetical protein GCM10011409_21280 [Lentibacillus populi]
MSFTKGSLRDYVNGKIDEARKEVRNEIDNYIKVNIKQSLIARLKDLENTTTPLHEVADKIEDFLVAVKLNGKWKYDHFVRDIRDASGLKNRIVESEMADINSAIVLDRPYKLFGLFDKVEQAKKDLRPQYKKIEEIKTLKQEIESTIKNAASGKQAYKSLIALGVDMEGYEEEVKMKLPSVQKLSVDPCLINGNCN